MTAVVALLSLGAGFAALALQRHYSDAAMRGEQLGRISQLLADGSGPRTAWAGWLAALLIALSTLRVRVGAMEPPARSEGEGVGGIRAGLRREFDVVRMCATVVAVLAAVDGGRLLAYTAVAISGSSLARDNLGWIAAESLGLAAAAATLLAWTGSFRSRLRQVGAI